DRAAAMAEFGRRPGCAPCGRAQGGRHSESPGAGRRLGRVLEISMMHIQQYVRADTELPPEPAEKRKQRLRRRRQPDTPSEMEKRMTELGRPWGGYVLSFDCE